MPIKRASIAFTTVSLISLILLIAGCSTDPPATTQASQAAGPATSTSPSTALPGQTVVVSTTTLATDQTGAARLYPASPAVDLSQEAVHGYIDSEGDWVIEPRFKWEREFSEGLAAVEIDRRIGYIDSTGTVVIEPVFDSAQSFSEGLAVAGGGGYIDKAGAWVITPRFQGAAPFSEGLAGVECAPGDSGGLEGYGFIDKTGAWVIPPRPEWMFVEDGFSEGLARVCEYYTGLVGFIDKTGAVIVEPQYNFARPFSEGLAMVRIDVGKGVYDWGYVDKTGALVLRFDHETYADVDSFSEAFAMVAMHDGDQRRKCGFIDRTGAWVIEPRFAWCGPFSEGLAAARLDGKCGYVDKTGAWVIEPRFQSAEPFSGALAWVYLDEVRGYIDKTGAFVYSEPWERPKGTPPPL